MESIKQIRVIADIAKNISYLFSSQPVCVLYMMNRQTYNNFALKSGICIDINMQNRWGNLQKFKYIFFIFDNLPSGKIQKELKHVFMTIWWTKIFKGKLKMETSTWHFSKYWPQYITNLMKNGVDSYEWCKIQSFKCYRWKGDLALASFL